jgi:phosphopantothenoylcysteine decarboxylase/phosphopantothenate--cysteine ligase
VLTENPDILAGIGRHTQRPALVVGFAAETHDLIPHAAAKRAKKGADWIVANDVTDGVFGTDSNHVHLITATGAEDWGAQAKADVATTLAARIAAHFAGHA